MNKLIQEDFNYINSLPLDWEKFNNKTVLITGAFGFIAQNIVEYLGYLKTKFNYKIIIIALVRDSKNFNMDLYTKWKVEYNVRFIIQDLEDEISPYDCDYIIHAASNATPYLHQVDPVGTITVNTVTTNNLLKLAGKKNAEFIYLSTTGVYGFHSPDKYPLSEDDFGDISCTEPSSCYIEGKRAGEALCIAYKNQYKVPVKIIRLGINYGYGMRLGDGRTSTNFVDNILNKKDFVLYGIDNAERSYLYIADTLAGIFTVMLKGESGEAYNLAAEEEISVPFLVYKLAWDWFKDRNLQIIRKSSPVKMRTNFVRTAMNINKICSLGYKQKYSLEEGFKRTVESYEI